MKNVSFIGLGAMGLAMANNILKHGHNVVGFDISSQAIAAHVANGGTTQATAAEAVAGAEIIITMLPNGAAVREAIFGRMEIVDTLATNAIIIDASTIRPFESDAVRTELLARNIVMIDAPVGRTSLQAVTGELLFMVGAEMQHLERVRPILECMGNSIVDCGGLGAGARMKIVNNLMTTCLNVLTAQVLTFSDATGLDRDLAISVMSGTAAGQGHMKTTYPAKVLQGDLSPAFMIDLAKKDLDIALTLSKQLNVPLSLAEQAEKIYTDAQKHGRGAQDWTAIFDMLSKNQTNTE